MSIRRRLLITACVSVVAFLSFSSASNAKDILPRLGGEQQVNVRTAGSQTTPAIASDAEGNYAVSWLGPDGQGRTTIWVRLFDAEGAPQTGEIEVAQPFGVSSLLAPKIAMAPDGRFVIAWFDFNVFLFRLFDAAGHPRGEPTPAWSVAPANLYGFPGDVAMGADGRFLLALDITGRVSACLFDQDGNPLEPIRPLSTDTTGANQFPHAVALADGSYLVTWVHQTVEPAPRNDQILGVRRVAQPGPWPAPVTLNTVPDRRLDQLVPLAHADGGFSIVWTSGDPIPLPTSPPSQNLRARRFDAAGSALGGETILPWSGSTHPPALAESRDGQTLVIVDGSTGSQAQGKLFGRSWEVVDPLDRPFVAGSQDIQIEPAVTRAKDGFVIASSSGSFPRPATPTISADDGVDIFTQRFGAPVCVAGSKVLCLGNFTGSADFGRFEVTVDWRTPDGATGAGRVATPFAWETGAFWFFQEDNLELVAKVLDGSAVNDRFWVFAGALSDVDYTLHVRDTRTGVLRTYHNPQGRLASLADTAAFPTGEPALAPSRSDADSLRAEALPPVAFDSATLATSSGLPLSTCGEEVLCPFPGREIRIGVDFVDPRTGLHGTGKATALTRNAGIFSFFQSGNAELIVKLLDGGPVNGKIWVFYGGLSDLDYTITIEDPASHATRTYHNSHGQLVSRADTRAFDASGLSF